MVISSKRLFALLFQQCGHGRFRGIVKQEYIVAATVIFQVKNNIQATLTEVQYSIQLQTSRSPLIYHNSFVREARAGLVGRQARQLPRAPDPTGAPERQNTVCLWFAKYVVCV